MMIIKRYWKTKRGKFKEVTYELDGFGFEYPIKSKIINKLPINVTTENF